MRRALLSIAALSFLCATSIAAGQAAPRVDRAERTLHIGDVLEVFGAGDATMTYGWVLTKDSQFVEAGKDQIFRTRLTQPGKYRLDGSMRTVTGAEMRLSLDLVAQPLTLQMGDGGETAEIVRVEATETTSASDALLTLIPSSWIQGEIRSDLDTARDSDGNGILDDDQDTGGTLFSTEHNTIHIWFADNGPRRVRLMTIAADGTPVTQSVGTDVLLPPTPTNISNGEELNGIVRFTFPIDPTVIPEEVLYSWSFGDGYTSLLDAPVHRYRQNGEYTVRVTVRTLATGNVVSQGESTIHISQVSPIGTLPSSPPSSSSSKSTSTAGSSSSASTAGQTAAAWGAIRLIIIITIIIFAAILLGLAALWIGRKFLHRESRLQKTLADAEALLVTSPETQSSLNAPAPPMSLRKAPAPQAEVVTSDIIAPAESAASTIVAEPAPLAKESAPAPTWLQQGLEKAKEAEQNANITDTSTEDIIPATPVTVQGEPLPPWLQETPAQEGDEFIPAPATPNATSVVTETVVTPTYEPTSAPVVTPAADPQPIAEPAPTQMVQASPTLEPAVEQISVDSEVSPQPKEAPQSTVEPAPQPTATPTPVSVAESPTPKVTPVAAVQVTPTAAAAPAPIALGADEAAKLERERERKRRKRQRYRENLRKRSAEDKSTAKTPASVVPSTTTSPPAEPAKPVTTVTDIPLAKTVSPNAPPANMPLPMSSDEDIKFVIKAESISDPPTPAGTDTPQA